MAEHSPRAWPYSRVASVPAFLRATQTLWDNQGAVVFRPRDIERLARRFSLQGIL